MHSRWKRIQRGRKRKRYIAAADGTGAHRPVPSVAVELPDFHLPHSEKIEWMVETEGFAVEPVAPDATTDPPRPGYTYTIGFPDPRRLPRRRRVRADAGRRPRAARARRRPARGGTEIPLDAELVGVLDNELRCRFAPVDLDVWGEWFATAQAWYRGQPFEVVQLVYPDRNGFLPYEPGFDHRLRFAQPVIGTIS